MTADTSTTAAELVPVASLREFFREAVDGALASNHVQVDTHTLVYITNLLTLFARADVFHGGADGPRQRPLSLMLNDALEAPDQAQKAYALQRLGDVALFVAGFMADSLHRQAVGIDYYVRMGGSAYHSLALAMPTGVRGRTFAPIFAELAHKFQDLVDVLNEVRSAAGSSSDQDVLRLYELWLATGSQRAARLLTELGVAPISQAGSSRTH